MNTPQMTTGTVEMVSVQWLINNVMHSVDGYSGNHGLHLERMLGNKALDSDFPALVHAIMTMGFRVPIVIDKGYASDGGLTLGNGHHRFCAALLLVLDEIPIYWADGNYMSSHMSDTESLPSVEWSDLRDMLHENLWY